jgi:hypothetical protein
VHVCMIATRKKCHDIESSEQLCIGWDGCHDGSWNIA